MSINADTLDVLDQYRTAAARITDDHTRTLVAAWVDSWNHVADELDDAVRSLTDGDTPPSRAKVRRSRKLAQALDSIGGQLDALARQTGITIVLTLPTAAELAGQTTTSLIATQLPPGTGPALVTAWDRVDDRAIASIITRTTQRIHASTLPLSDAAVASMRRHLIRGLAAGDNPRETARRMIADTEGIFNGGLTRALTISRTETLDAMREASHLAYDANRDLVGGWTWTATLGSRTCPACWAMHGTDFPVESPGPEGHPNCRCTAIPRTKTWAELGFTGIEEPPSLLPDPQAMFDNLPPATQVKILGPKRHDAWAAGRYPMSQWAVRKDNPDWRPSYVVAPAPMVTAA